MTHKEVMRLTTYPASLTPQPNRSGTFYNLVGWGQPLAWGQIGLFITLASQKDAVAQGCRTHPRPWAGSVGLAQSNLGAGKQVDAGWVGMCHNAHSLFHFQWPGPGGPRDPKFCARPFLSLITPLTSVNPVGSTEWCCGPDPACRPYI